jgi:uncharacterized protein (TIGR02145 family)
VSWPGDAAVDRVWVWIDLSPITGTSPGTFEKAVISGATATAGSITTVDGNTRGFYVTTNPSTVTATLSNAASKFNWCAYGSDAPPNVTAANGTYTLYGTPPFILTAAGGTATQTVDATTIETSAVTVTPVTLTDQTGCPGVFCIYTGSDLFIDGTHLCQTRASGAQNWEAWIKDTRDDELYRIVLMPDTKWWLAQNVKLEKYNSATVGSANSNCTKDECGLQYSYANAYAAYGGSSGSGNVQGVCPPGWLLPVSTDWHAFADNISHTEAVILERLRPKNSKFTWNDYYGWANIKGVVAGKLDTTAGYYGNDTWTYNRHWGFGLDKNGTAGLYYNNNDPCCIYNASVRCFRQL